MAPLNNDMGLLSTKDGERMGQMNSIQRISAQSLMMLRPRGKNIHEKPGGRSPSLRDLLREHTMQSTPSISPPLSPTEKKQEPSMILLLEQETEILPSDPTARREATEVMIPTEINLIDEFGVEDDCKATGADMILDEARHLEASKVDLETLRKNLKKSRKQVQALIIHNKAMLDKLVMITKKDEATSDTHAILKQEITLLKACLFLSMIFVMCGGRAEFIALVVFGWTIADVFV